MQKRSFLVAAGLLAGCVQTTDPGDGGFFAGVQNIQSGAYDKRVAERETAVRDAELRNTALKREQAALATQISAAESELAKARFRLLQLRDAHPNLDPATRSRVNRALLAEPQGAADDAARLAQLQTMLAETRALSEELAALNG